MMITFPKHITTREQLTKDIQRITEQIRAELESGRPVAVEFTGVRHEIMFEEEERACVPFEDLRLPGVTE